MYGQIQARQGRARAGHATGEEQEVCYATPDGSWYWCCSSAAADAGWAQSKAVGRQRVASAASSAGGEEEAPGIKRCTKVQSAAV